MVYSHLEMSVGIICACLPACRSLLEYYFPSLKMTFRDTSSPGLRDNHHRSQSGRFPRAQRLEKSSRSFAELSNFDAAASRLGNESSVETGVASHQNGGKRETRDVNEIYMTMSVEMKVDSWHEESPATRGGTEDNVV